MPDTFGHSRDVGSAVQSCPLKQEPVHWIEIELVGEDDLPIPWAEYRIKLPNSTLVTGYLDRNGFARLDGLLQSGVCGVCFPEFDEEAWTFLQTYPSPRRQEEAAHAGA